MDKNLIIISLLLSSYLFAINTQDSHKNQKIVIKNSWQIVGSEHNISIEAFDNTCVDFIWQYDISDINNPIWRLRVTNNKSYDSIDRFSKIKAFIPGQGFWVKGNGECNITVGDTNATTSTTLSAVIKKTGQIKSYSVGIEITDGSVKDDGYYQKGVTPSYTRDDTNDIVIDNITGLMWQDTNTTVEKSWLSSSNNQSCTNDRTSNACFDTSGDTASSYCSNLTLGGYTDWRLPSVEELENLLDYSRRFPAIDTNYFHNTISGNYWTSTTSANDNMNAWYVDFAGGVVLNTTPKWYSNLYVRCVRDKN